MARLFGFVGNLLGREQHEPEESKGLETDSDEVQDSEIDVPEEVQNISNALGEAAATGLAVFGMEVAQAVGQADSEIDVPEEVQNISNALGEAAATGLAVFGMEVAQAVGQADSEIDVPEEVQNISNALGEAAATGLAVFGMEVAQAVGQAVVDAGVAALAAQDDPAPVQQEIQVSNWDGESATGTLAQSLRYRGAKACLVWSPDNSRLACVVKDDQTVTVWNAQSGTRELLPKETSSVVEALAWNPTGKQFATMTKNTVQVWSATSGAEEWNYTPPGRIACASCFAFDWSKDGTKLAIGGDFCKVFVCDAKLGTETCEIEIARPKTLGFSIHGEEVRSVAWNPDGVRVAAVTHKRGGGVFGDGSDIKTQMINLEQSSMELAYKEGSLAWSPDGSQLATACLDGKKYPKSIKERAVAMVWDATSKTILATLKLPSTEYNVGPITWSSDGRMVATLSSSGYNRRATVWDLKSEPVKLMYYIAGCDILAWSPVGNLLATANSTDSSPIALKGARVYKCNLEENELLDVLTGHPEGSSGRLAWNSDGTRLASVAPGLKGGKTGSVIVWDTSAILRRSTGSWLGGLL